MLKQQFLFYVDRQLLDLDSNLLVLVSKAVSHPDMPAESKYVRVTDYDSKMAVRSHGEFTEVT